MKKITKSEGNNMAAMIICGECHGKMRLITRSANSSTPINNKEYLFINYAICTTCGTSAKVQTTVEFIRKPLIQIDLFENGIQAA